MKVVLFCGGLGTRIREYSESIPKPMIPLGHQPILRHVMQYYSQYGHDDFVLCLGYKANVIKDFFLNYRPQTLRRLRRVRAAAASVELLGEHARGLARHADRYRASGAISASACGPCATCAGRGDLPRQLQRRPDRRRSRRHGRTLQGERQACLLPRRAAAAHLPPRRYRRRRPRPRVPHLRPLRHLDQWRLFPLRDGRSSTTCARARSWCSSRSSG